MQLSEILERLVRANLSNDASLNVFLLLAIIGVIIGLYKYRQLGVSLRILLFYTIISFVFETIVNDVYSILIGNNRLPFKIFMLLELIAFSLFYYTTYTIKPLKKFVQYTSISVFLVAAYLSLISQSIHEPWGATASIVCIYIMILSLVYFFQLIQEMQFKRIEHDPHFWISIGTLMYTSTTALVFLTLNMEGIGEFWRISHFSRTLLNGMIAYAFWISNKKWVQQEQAY